MSDKRRYPTDIEINGRRITEIVIDPYYKKKHPDINDQIILDLVGLLNGREFQADERQDDWEYFMLDRIEHPKMPGLQYRLIWCVQDHSMFLGVVNCFRR